MPGPTTCVKMSYGPVQMRSSVGSPMVPSAGVIENELVASGPGTSIQNSANETFACKDVAVALTVTTPGTIGFGSTVIRSTLGPVVSQGSRLVSARARGSVARATSASARIPGGATR